MMMMQAMGGICAPRIGGEIVAWAKACTDKPSLATMIALQTIVDEGTRAGWWSGLTLFRPFMADTWDAASRNLKNPAHVVSTHGAGVHAASFGWFPDGTTNSWLGEGKTAVQLGLALDDHFVGVYLQTDNAGTYNDLGAIGGTSGRLGLRGRNVTGIAASLWSGTTTAFSLPVSSALGFLGLVRKDSAGAYGLKKDKAVRVISPSVALPTAELQWAAFGVTRGVNLLAFGLAGIIQPQHGASISFALDRALDILGVRSIEEPQEPVGANCWPRSTNDLLPAGKIYMVQGNPPIADDQDNVAKYTATTKAIVFTADAYTTDDTDLAYTLRANCGSTNRTVTLMGAAAALAAATSAGIAPMQVVRKVDKGAGTCTVNGVVLSDVYDTVIFVTDGTSWVESPATTPLVRAYANFPCTDTFSRPWLVSGTQTLIGVWNYINVPRGAGEVEGTITSPTLRAQIDTMTPIVLSSGITARIEVYDTYDQAMVAGWVAQAWENGFLMRDEPRCTDLPILGHRAAGWGVLDIADYCFETSPWTAYLGDPTSLYTDVNIDTGPVMHWARANATKDSLFVDDAIGGTFKVAKNIVILGRKRIAEAPIAFKGNTLDTEMSDGRSEAQLLATMQGHAIIAHAAGLLVGSWGHSPGSVSWQKSGWSTANIAELTIGADPAACLDHISLLASRFVPNNDMAAFLDSQFAACNPTDDPAINDRLLVQLHVGGPDAEMPIEHAQAIHDFTVAHDLAGTFLFNWYSQPGGRLELPRNQIIATINGLPTT